MTVMYDLARIAAATLPVWRDAAVALLAALVIGCLLFIASVVEP